MSTYSNIDGDTDTKSNAGNAPKRKSILGWLRDRIWPDPDPKRTMLVSSIARLEDPLPHLRSVNTVDPGVLVAESTLSADLVDASLVGQNIWDLLLEDFPFLSKSQFPQQSFAWPGDKSTECKSDSDIAHWLTGANPGLVGRMSSSYDALKSHIRAELTSNTTLSTVVFIRRAQGYSHTAKYIDSTLYITTDTPGHTFTQASLIENQLNSQTGTNEFVCLERSPDPIRRVRLISSKAHSQQRARELAQELHASLPNTLVAIVDCPHDWGFSSGGELSIDPFLREWMNKPPPPASDQTNEEWALRSSLAKELARHLPGKNKPLAESHPSLQASNYSSPTSKSDLDWALNALDSRNQLSSLAKVYVHIESGNICIEHRSFEDITSHIEQGRSLIKEARVDTEADQMRVDLADADLKILKAKIAYKLVTVPKEGVEDDGTVQDTKQATQRQYEESVKLLQEAIQTYRRYSRTETLPYAGLLNTLANMLLKIAKRYDDPRGTAKLLSLCLVYYVTALRLRLEYRCSTVVNTLHNIALVYKRFVAIQSEMQSPLRYSVLNAAGQDMEYTAPSRERSIRMCQCFFLLSNRVCDKMVKPAPLKVVMSQNWNNLQLYELYHKHLAPSTHLHNAPKYALASLEFCVRLCNQFQVASEQICDAARRLKPTVRSGRTQQDDVSDERSQLTEKVYAVFEASDAAAKLERKRN